MFEHVVLLLVLVLGCSVEEVIRGRGWGWGMGMGKRESKYS